MVLILAASVSSVLQVPPVVFAQGAGHHAPPVFTDENGVALPANYVPVYPTVVTNGSSDFSLDVITQTDSAQIQFQGNLNGKSPRVQELLQGLSGSQGSGSKPLHYHHLTWDLSGLLTERNSAFPRVLGSSLKALTDDGGASTSQDISVVIYKDQVPMPTITIDKQQYSQGDSVQVTVSDIMNYKNAFIENNSVAEDRIISKEPTLHAAVQKGNSSVADVSLKEVSPYKDFAAPMGTFRGTFVIPADWCSATSCPAMILSYGSGSRLVPSQPIKISAVKLSLDRPLYALGDTAKITLSGAPVHDTSERIQLDSGAAQSTTFLSCSSGTCTGTFSILSNQIAGVPSDPSVIPANEGDNLTVTYTGSDAQPVTAGAAILGTPSVTFTHDDPIGYWSTDVGRIKVIDAHANRDPTSNDIVSVTVTSDESTSPVVMNLRETGPNTGIFTELSYLQFTFDNTLKDADAIQVSKSLPTNLIVTYSGSAGELDPAVTGTITVYPRLPAVPYTTMGGVGGETTPNTFSAYTDPGTSLSCSSFGGDPTDDGICAQWESPVKSFLTIPYPDTNSLWQFRYFSNPVPSSSDRDLLLEIDNASRPGMNDQGPSFAAEDYVKNQFLNKGGVYLQYAPSEEAPLPAGSGSQIDVWQDASNSGDQDSYRGLKLTYFGDSSSRLTTNAGKALKQVEHYMLWGAYLYQDWTAQSTSSGVAEITGNNAIVTLGAFSPVNTDKEEGALMHELGHEIGLNHGGGQETSGGLHWVYSDYAANCKPTYLSVMSFSQEWPNALSSLNLANWVRSYSNDTMNINAYTFNPSSHANLPETYNTQTGLNPTQESQIDIAWGTPNTRTVHQQTIYKTPTGQQNWIDWNGDGQISSGPVYGNIINLGVPGCDSSNVQNAKDSSGNYVIHGFNDWQSSPAHLILNFRNYNPSAWNFGMSGLGAHQDMNLTMWRAILKAGILSLNDKIQNLPDSDFVNGNESKKQVETMLIANSSESVSDITIINNTLAFSPVRPTFSINPEDEVVVVGNSSCTNPSDLNFTVTLPNGTVNNIVPQLLENGSFFANFPSVTAHLENYKLSAKCQSQSASKSYGPGSTNSSNSVTSLIDQGNPQAAAARLEDVLSLVQGANGLNNTHAIIKNIGPSDPVYQHLITNIQVLQRDISPNDGAFALATVYAGQYHTMQVNSLTVKPQSWDFSVIPGVGFQNVIVKGDGIVDISIDRGLLGWNQTMSSSTTQIKVDGNLLSSGSFTVSPRNNTYFANDITFAIKKTPGSSSDTVHTIEIYTSTTVPEFGSGSLPIIALTIAILAIILLFQRSKGFSFGLQGRYGFQG